MQVVVHLDWYRPEGKALLVRRKAGGELLGYRSTALIANPVFTIDRATKRRAKQIGKRLPHAFVIGELVDDPSLYAWAVHEGVPVIYRPMQDETWWREDTGGPVTAALWALARRDDRYVRTIWPPLTGAEG